MESITIAIDNRALANGEHPYTVEDIVTNIRTLYQNGALCKNDLRSIVRALEQDTGDSIKRQVYRPDFYDYFGL